MIESEIIVRYVLEKLISYTLTETTRTQIKQKIPQFTYDYIKTLLNDTLNLDMITYDLDLTEKNRPKWESVGDSPQFDIFYENRICGENDYSVLTQPVSRK